MPWEITQDPSCPADKPFAVVKADGTVEGCHETEEMAKAQQAALYANEQQAESVETEVPEGPEQQAAQSGAMEYLDARDIWPMEDMALKADRKGLHFTGYAAPFNVWSEPRGYGWRMRIHDEAFTHTLSSVGRPKKMFLNHNDGIVLGSTRKGTLRLSTDSRGLLAEADLPDNEWGRPVADAVDRGDIEGMSIGMKVPPTTKRQRTEQWSTDRLSRDVYVIDLYEVSPITSWPGFTQTSVSMMSLLAPDELTRALAVLQTPDGLLDEEQHALLLASIESHRARPTAAEVRAQWADRFGLSQ